MVTWLPFVGIHEGPLKRVGKKPKDLCFLKKKPVEVDFHLGFFSHFGMEKKGLLLHVALNLGI